MKKQKLFVLIKHGADNQDRSQGADGRRGG